MLKQSFLHEGATGMFGSADARVNPILILLRFEKLPVIVLSSFSVFEAIRDIQWQSRSK